LSLFCSSWRRWVQFLYPISTRVEGGELEGNKSHDHYLCRNVSLPKSEKAFFLNNRRHGTKHAAVLEVRKERPLLDLQSDLNQIYWCHRHASGEASDGTRSSVLCGSWLRTLPLPVLLLLARAQVGAWRGGRGPPSRQRACVTKQAWAGRNRLPHTCASGAGTPCESNQGRACHRKAQHCGRRGRFVALASAAPHCEARAGAHVAASGTGASCMAPQHACIRRRTTVQPAYIQCRFLWHPYRG